MRLGPGRQSVVVAANSEISPPGHAAERRVDGLQRRISGTDQALADVVEAVPHVPDRLFIIIAWALMEGGVVTLVNGPLTQEGGMSISGAERSKRGSCGCREVEVEENSRGREGLRPESPGIWQNEKEGRRHTKQ